MAAVNPPDLNAPGEQPSVERVDLVARKSLGLDEDPEAVTPVFYVVTLTKFLTANPGDDNFLLELPTKGTTMGGNGYGSVTCMEAGCWSDIVLSADPDLPDGGRENGLGSFYEYALHCRNEDHIHHRDQRLKCMGLQIPAPVSQVAVLPQDIVNSSAVSPPAAGPSRLATAVTTAAPVVNTAPLFSKPAFHFDAENVAAGSAAAGPSSKSASTPLSASSSAADIKPNIFAEAGPSRLSAFGSSSSSGLRDHSLNLLDQKPDVSSSPKVKDWAAHRTPVNNDADSDEDIVCLGQSSPRRPARRHEVLLVDSDDDDIKPMLSSQSTLSSSQKPPYVKRWSEMNIPDKLAAVQLELDALRKARPITPDQRGAVGSRKSELRQIKSSFGIRTWIPPSQTVLKLIPRTAIDPRLADTFTWPYVAPPQPKEEPAAAGAMPGAFAGSAVAGPSTHPMAGPPGGPAAHQNAFRAVGPGVFPPYELHRSPAEYNTIWSAIDRDTRVRYSRDEQNMLARFYQAMRANPLADPMLKRDVLVRHVEAMQRWTAPDASNWKPPTALLMKNCPELRGATHPNLVQFLPDPEANVIGFEDMDMDHLDYYGGAELDRPQTAQGLTTFFQDALQDFKEDATIEDGLKALNLASLDDEMPGANFKLLPHQVLGVAFMVGREKRTSGPKGGLLCDAMGLGKTVQTLGLMLQRDKRPSDFKKAPQLIIAPVALLAQWKEEIETKTTVGWKVHIHHGTSRLKSPGAIRQYDIILTSYGTLRAEVFPNGMKKKKKKRPAHWAGGSESESESDYRDHAPPRSSPLLKTKWFRVILDEAHNIRNKGTATSKAVMELDYLHPWFLSGTPIVNSLADIGPALSFIGLMDLDEFHKRVTKMEKKKPRLATKRAQAILKPLMMRRNKDSEINGRKILELPPKITNMDQLTFSPDERAIYTSVEQRAKVRVNTFLREGTLMKNYQVVLVLLLRLRQAVNHPWLLRRRPGEEAREDDLLVDDDVLGANMTEARANDSDEYGRAVGLLGQPAVDVMREKLEERYNAMTDDAENDEPQDLECSICYEPFDGTEMITKCCHIYCKGCVDSLFGQPLRDATSLSDEEAQRGCRVCPLCRAVLERGEIFRVSAIFTPPQDKRPSIDDDVDDASDSEDVATDRKGKGKAKPPQDKGRKRASAEDAAKFFGKKQKLDEEGNARIVNLDDDENEVDELDEENIEDVIPPSTKMKQLLTLVQGYLEEDSTTKILVFSQFVQFLDLLSDYLNGNGVRNIDYRGSMNQNERSEAIRRFSMPSAIADSISVMLISTKAGGVGLNLTMAHKVICCDLAWNPATENQAVDRAHRIGQTKEVTVERLVISNTVEERLLAIQEQKGLLADGAMGEGAVGKIGRLTAENIRMLFAIDRDYHHEDD